jgi:hypothetical protein
MNLESNFQYNLNMSGEEVLKITRKLTGKNGSMKQNTRRETGTSKKTYVCKSGIT